MKLVFVKTVLGNDEIWAETESGLVLPPGAAIDKIQAEARKLEPSDNDKLALMLARGAAPAKA